MFFRFMYFYISLYTLDFANSNLKKAYQAQVKTIKEQRVVSQEDLLRHVKCLDGFVFFATGVRLRQQQLR